MNLVNTVRNKIPFLLLTLLVLLLPGCSMLKDSKLAEVYHNITARYNGYFNARELMAATEQILHQNEEDDFSQILPIFKYGTEAGAKAEQANLNTIIQKCSNVIDKHPDSKWEDDCYLLIGKAYFLKLDYHAANEVFEYIASKYKNEPIASLANLWIVRSYLELDMFADAQARMSRINLEKGFPKEYLVDKYLTEAAVRLAADDYQSALESLQKVLPLLKKKDVEVRFHFIAGQLNSVLEEPVKASKHYLTVIKKNPEYEFAFNSRVALARNYAGTGMSKEEVVELLAKMLRDDKNDDFHDQIYYELAQFALRENEVDKGIDLLNKSIQASTTNSNQKAISYLALAELYFEMDEFYLSKVYFDSTATSLSRDYPDYENLIQKKEVLDELIGYIISVQREDSLQMVARLPSEEREKFIQNVIEQEKLQRERAKALAENSPITPNSPFEQSNVPGDMGMGGNDDWYFYNPAALGVGYNEFVTRWGNRPLEDNWRRSEKEVVAVVDPGEPEPGEAAEDYREEMKDVNAGVIPETLVDVPQDMVKYYQNLPFNLAQVNASNATIAEALFNIGTIYAEKLHNYPEAVGSYEQLLERFPDNQYAMETYYKLYKVYLKMQDVAAANRTKETLLEKYPSSQYAQLLANPEAFRQRMLNAKRNEPLEQGYTAAYAAYQKGNCKAVFEFVKEAEATWPGNYLRPKYQYLRVLCEGKELPKEEFIARLEGIVDSYPGTEIIPHAQKVIAYLKRDGQAAIEDSAAVQKDFSQFVENNEAPFFYVLTFQFQSSPLGQIKVGLSDYNTQHYELDRLSISSFLLNKETQAVVVKEFKTMDKAQRYLRGIASDEKLQSRWGINQYDHFVISAQNFRDITRDNLLGEYLEYFAQTFE